MSETILSLPPLFPYSNYSVSLVFAFVIGNSNSQAFDSSQFAYIMLKSKSSRPTAGPYQTVQSVYVSSQSTCRCVGCGEESSSAGWG